MADWSMLPHDVLGDIALKLDTIEDFVYFSTVCHSWNDASSIVKRERNATKMMPWLLLAENTKENPNHHRKIFNLSNNKCYQLSMPETFGARCWGSSYGWIVLQTFDKQVHLFNPLTKDQITSLPSLLQTMPKLLNKIVFPEKDEWFWKKYVCRVVVLKMPQSNRPPRDDEEELLVALIYGEFDYFALARPGDQAWTLIDKGVEDVACCGNMVYIVKADASLQCCDIKGIRDFKAVKVVEYLPFSRCGVSAFDKFYILNSGDDILMVIRFKEEVPDENDSDDYDLSIIYRTNYFEVFKLDSERRKWVEIKDLGNFLLFVGNNSAIFVSASAAKNCTRNCIYFTDDESRSWERVIDFGGLDMGVYNLDSGNVTQFYHAGEVRSEFCPPIFFVPNC